MKLPAAILLLSLATGSLWNAPSLWAVEPAAIGRVNLTIAQYHAANKELQARDYRPASLSVYRVKGENLHAAMWQRAGGIPWKEGLHRSAKEFEADSKLMQDDEFRPISLHVLAADGQPRYSILWKKLDGEYYYFQDRLPAEKFRTFSDDYSKRDIYPTSICAYELRGQLLYAGIWEKTRPGSVEYQLGLTETALAQKTKALRDRGFHPQFLSASVSRGRPMWSAIWVQQEGVEVEALPALSEADWQKRSTELEKAGYDLMSLQGTTVAGKPRFCAVWRKVKELPEESGAVPK